MTLEDTIHLVIVSLRDNGAPAELIAATVADLRKAAKQEKDTPATPKAKTRFVALVRGDLALQKALDGGAWIVSVPDGDEDPTTTTYHGGGLVNRLRKAALAHNEAPKGRRKAKTKVTTWRELFAYVKASTIKASESAITFRQKGTPCEVVVLTEETISP